MPKRFRTRFRASGNDEAAEIKVRSSYFTLMDF